MKRKLRAISNKQVLYGAVVITAAFVAVVIIHRKNQPTISPAPTATIHQLPIQAKPGSQVKVPTNSNGTNQGTATDNRGQTPGGVSTPSSQWVQSQSGNITVKQPTVNSVFNSGNVLSGSAKVGQVHYRLIDNNVGVISEGLLSVVNGDFSGTMHFTPISSTGRLDVFSTDPNGKEINEVQIAVSF